jgi:Xaa-Pro aminopeptidase
MSHQSRLKNAQTYLNKHDIDGMIIQDPIMLYYMTGLEVSMGTLLITSKEANLLVDGRYIEAARDLSPFPVTLAKSETLRQVLRTAPYSSLRTLAFDTTVTPFFGFSKLKSVVSEKTALKGVDCLFQTLRLIKDEQELAWLTEAAALGSMGYDYVCGLLTEGISEIEVARALEIFWLKEGGEGLAFDPIIAFGSNTSKPHYRPGNLTLAKGQPVLIDIGVRLHQYCSDMTRVVFFGDPKAKMREIYDVVLSAQLEALKACKPGVFSHDVDKAGRSVIEAAGYGEYFDHGLGHGVGLDVHESPTLRHDKDLKGATLQPGMVVTVEPGVYLPGVGGVRIEDTIVITDDGFRDLTQRDKSPKTLNPAEAIK